MNFTDIALILGSLVLAVLSTTALVTVLLRRRHTTRQRKPWLKTMLRTMQQSDNYKGRINPARIGIEKL